MHPDFKSGSISYHKNIPAFYYSANLNNKSFQNYAESVLFGFSAGNAG